MKNFRVVNYANIKDRLLFRSEALNSLSIEEQKLLINSGVTTIVDLRGVDERAAREDTIIKGIKNVSIPLSVIDDARLITYRGLQLPDLKECYQQLVSLNLKEAWSNIFEILLNNDGVLFHCSQGKDRTGVVIAVILNALGIDKEIIFKDYLLTNERPVFFGNQDLPKEVQEILADYFSAKPEYLQAAFDYIKEQYGSIEDFLKKCCSLDEAKIAAFRNKYLNN